MRAIRLHRAAVTCCGLHLQVLEPHAVVDAARATGSLDPATSEQISQNQAHHHIQNWMTCSHVNSCAEVQTGACLFEHLAGLWADGQVTSELQPGETCTAMLRAIEAVHAAYASGMQPATPVKPAKAAGPSSKPRAGQRNSVALQPPQACPGSLTCACVCICGLLTRVSA